MNFPNLIKFPNGFTQKTKCTTFHTPQIKDKLALKLPILSVNNHKIERSSIIKLIGKIVDENLNQKGFINTLANEKISQYESNDIHLLLVSLQLSDLWKYCYCPIGLLSVGLLSLGLFSDGAAVLSGYSVLGMCPRGSVRRASVRSGYCPGIFLPCKLGTNFQLFQILFF